MKLIFFLILFCITPIIVNQVYAEETYRGDLEHINEDENNESKC